MILQSLKERTAAAHARTEASLPPLDALATPAGYAHALLAMYGFYKAWEPAVWNVPCLHEVGLLRAERQKLPQLTRDLEMLGFAEALGAVPVPAAPSLDCMAALGTMYVLEGATLGGRVIERHVNGHVPVTPDRGGEFFHGYGQQTGERWKAFGAALDQWVHEHRDSGEHIIGGALACFDALDGWLRSRGGAFADALSPLGA